MKQEKKEEEGKAAWSLFFYLYLLNWLQKCLVRTVAVSCGQSLTGRHRREIAFGTLLPKRLMPSEGLFQVGAACLVLGFGTDTSGSPVGA